MTEATFNLSMVARSLIYCFSEDGMLDDLISCSGQLRLLLRFGNLALSTIESISYINHYSMDEIGLQEGLGSNGLYLGSSEKKLAFRKASKSRIWITILECISVPRITLTPLVIFTGQSIQL